MSGLSEAGRLSIVTLLRQIIESNPPITVLSLNGFSMNPIFHGVMDHDHDQNIGELVLEILMSSNIG